jgi:hypothetical protein
VSRAIDEQNLCSAFELCAKRQKWIGKACARAMYKYDGIKFRSTNGLKKKTV